MPTRGAQSSRFFTTLPPPRFLRCVPWLCAKGPYLWHYARSPTHSAQNFMRGRRGHRAKILPTVAGLLAPRLLPIPCSRA